MLREFLPETLVLSRNALGRNGNPAPECITQNDRQTLDCINID